MLGVSLVVVTCLYLWFARLNERHAVRMMVEAKKRAEALLAEPDEHP